VGGIIVRDRRILSTGYNGTPTAMRNCEDGGCHRCAHPEAYPSGEAYDLCICVHAEQNALLAAARFGVSVEGCTMYTTLQPCFGCLKEILQASVREVCYLTTWESRFRDQYDALVERLGRDNFRLVALPDPDAEWALGRARDAGERTLGHESLAD
jgi:dCMP deaminase